MQYKSIFFFMTFLLSLSTYDQAQSQGLTWEFSRATRDIHGNETKRNISYSVNPEITRIEDAKEIIYIDYAKYALYTYNKLDGACLKFPLKSNNITEPVDTKEGINKRNISSIGSLKVFTTTEHKEIGHYNCSLRHVLFGADLAMFQMVSPLVVHEFNQKFTESMVGYYVSKDVVGLKTLLHTAQKRSVVFKNNPLLRQVDIIGLLEILEGFPVQIIKKNRDTDSLTTLSGNPEPIGERGQFLFPGECRE